MIDFELTQTQKMIQQFSHQIAVSVIRPGSLLWDRTHKVPDSVLEQLAMIRGGMSIDGGGEELPQELGGAADETAQSEGQTGKEKTGKEKKGKSQKNRMTLIGAEELAWGDVAVMMSLPGPGLGGPPVQLMGTREQQKRFFGVLDQPGLHWGAYGLTEPGAGSDVSSIRTSCKKDGKSWVLNGRKCYITNGGRADWVTIFATIDPALGRAGHRVFVVEKGTPGFFVGKIEQKMGLRASETAELVLEDSRVSEDNLLGGEAYYRGKEGFMGAMATFDFSRPLVGVMGLGIGRAAYEYARDFVRDNYVLTRPVPRYAQIAAMLADNARRLSAARLLCWRAAWMADEGIPNAREASMAKAYAAQTAMRVCADAVQIVGAHGLSSHELVEKWYRDIKVFDIFEGTGQIQRIVISKRILREPPTF